METLDKYKPTGSNEVDKILRAAHQTIQKSNTLRNEIQGEVNQQLNQKSHQQQSFIKSIMNHIFK